MRLPAPIKAAAAAVVLVLSLSCSILEDAAAQFGGAPAATASSGAASPDSQDAPLAEMEEVTDPRVESVLALRSVQMEVSTRFPDAETDRIRISIDAAGNARMEYLMPVFEDSMVTQESPDWNAFEIFLVDGEAYIRSGKTGSAEADPEQKDALRETLYSPTAPGMWLILLPVESFTSAGKESKNGFDAEKYLVEGSLEFGDIRGEIWVDDTTGALVGAVFTLDEGIYHPFEESTGGVVTIEFSVQKADVTTISLP